MRPATPARPHAWTRSAELAFVVEEGVAAVVLEPPEEPVEEAVEPEDPVALDAAPEEAAAEEEEPEEEPKASAEPTMPP
jgi:hypothetical protein